jgi:hypothetical protein
MPERERSVSNRACARPACGDRKSEIWPVLIGQEVERGRFPIEVQLEAMLKNLEAMRVSIKEDIQEQLEAHQICM